MPVVHAPVRHELAVRKLWVNSVVELGPRMRRFILGGSELDGFVSLGPTDHVKLIVPGPDELELKLPSIEDGRIRRPEGTPTPARDYTIRHHDPVEGVLAVDVVTHGSGHVSSWAESATNGSVVGIAGPRGSHPMPEAEHYLLAGDLSALPAIARWLEELAGSSSARVWIAAEDHDDQFELTSDGNIEVEWLSSDAAAAVAAESLAPAISSNEPPRGDVYAWAGGEVVAMRAVRDVFRNFSALDEDHLSVDGYWRRGRTDYDHHASLDDD